MEKFRSNKLYISNQPSTDPNELTIDVQPDQDIRNLVMEQNVEHLFEHRKFVDSPHADVGCRHQIFQEEEDRG